MCLWLTGAKDRLGTLVEREEGWQALYKVHSYISIQLSLSLIPATRPVSPVSSIPFALLLLR